MDNGTNYGVAAQGAPPRKNVRTAMGRFFFIWGAERMGVMSGAWTRRRFLAGTTALALGASAWGAETDGGEAMRLKPGDRFNESVELKDKATGRPTRQLTTKRLHNQQPTYHLNACFSADSRYMALATQFEDGSSALLRGEVATGELTVLGVLPKSVKPAFNGNNVGMIQSTGWVSANAGGCVHLYHLETFEHRVVIDMAKEGRRFGHPMGSIDGKNLYVPLYRGETTVNGMTVNPVTHMEVDLATGKRREIFREDGAQCNHVVACPNDPETLLIDRDWPPLFGSGGDQGKTSRVWLLGINTGKLTEVRPKNTNRFQIHSNWSHKGEYVYYHGVHESQKFRPHARHYIGVADKTGKVVWEHVFPEFTYGHICSHTRANVILTDGLLSKNKVTAVYWEELDKDGAPRTEVLAQHDTDWKPGQFSHPHCHMSPDGKWLSYNRGHDGRSDVYVVRLG